jgi:prophage regulatory protein
VIFLQRNDLKLRGIPWSRQYLWTLEQRGKFPRRVKLGPGTIVWAAQEIDEWLAARAAARDEEAK